MPRSSTSRPAILTQQFRQFPSRCALARGAKDGDVMPDHVGCGPHVALHFRLVSQQWRIGAVCQSHGEGLKFGIAAHRRLFTRDFNF
jgi:hypothetical protein